MVDLLKRLFSGEIRLTEHVINDYVSGALHDNPVVSEARVLLSPG